MRSEFRFLTIRVIIRSLQFVQMIFSWLLKGVELILNFSLQKWIELLEQAWTIEGLLYMSNILLILTIF